MDYEIVIGLEVHLQLSTASKIFCSSSAAFGADPNTNIDPLTFGLPGSLPVLNKQVVESAMMLGMALGCEINKINRFARKHYFYPDLPKGYQISQYAEPICERGQLNIVVEGSKDGSVEQHKRVIGVTRIHMEEDAGKNIHDSRTRSSLIDLNRAGVPLLEIVSEPDMRSAAEAVAYLKALRQIARYLNISDGNMEEGSLRCDANISLRPKGQLKFGTRTEVKNINSFRFVEKAINYEVARQLSILKGGGTIVQETRLFDSAKETTHAMRSKEESADYRYFPDPDLPPLEIDTAWIRQVESQMPELPAALAEKLVLEMGLSEYDASVLTAESEDVNYFLNVYKECKNAKAACNWVTSELFGALNKAGQPIINSPISAKSLGRLIVLIDTGTISGKMAKEVFEEAFLSGEEPESIVEKKGLRQLTSEDDILALVRQTLDDNPLQLADLFAGKDKLKGFFVGQIMKLSAGKAHPQMVNELLDKELAARQGGKGG
jgi:aspartyl-tRNA(Asn)/glutamyl-tRNA(Gln) amidotransferase subunit B